MTRCTTRAGRTASCCGAGGAKVHHVHYPSMIHGFFGMVGQIDAAEVAQDEVAGQLKLAFA